MIADLKDLLVGIELKPLDFRQTDRSRRSATTRTVDGRPDGGLRIQRVSNSSRTNPAPRTIPASLVGVFVACGVVYLIGLVAILLRKRSMRAAAAVGW